jgi:hypothetical protein
VWMHLSWPVGASVAAVRSGPVFSEIFGTEDRTSGPSPVLRGAAGPDR